MTGQPNDSAVIITGAAGGIGQALVRCFAEAGCTVIATDQAEQPVDMPCRHYVRADLQRTVADESYASDIFKQIRTRLDGMPLKALINNAAVQILGPVEALDRNAWRTTLDVNLLAPLFWIQGFLPELETTRGSVVNISSIHAHLTKVGFVAYATSKAALSGMTRAMAVELGGRIQVNAIEPAAIDTPMLHAGFGDDSIGLERLRAYHPAGCLGSTQALAALALAIVGTGADSAFLNGAIIPFNGGIGARLHDPG